MKQMDQKFGSTSTSLSPFCSSLCNLQRFSWAVGATPSFTATTASTMRHRSLLYILLKYSIVCALNSIFLRKMQYLVQKNGIFWGKRGFSKNQFELFPRDQYYRPALLHFRLVLLFYLAIPNECITMGT